MKTSSVFLVLLLAVFFSYTAIAQELGSLHRSYEPTIPEKVESPIPEPLHAGTYTIGYGGYFPTIQSAFDKLSSDGIDGEVTLELINTTYLTVSGQYGFILNGPIRGASESNRIRIKPAENKNVTIMGNGETVLLFINASYITLDGVDIEGPTTLTICAAENLQFPYNDCIDFWNNSDNNVVQNITFISEDYTRSGTGIMIWNQPNSLSPPDGNLIQNNFIKEAGVGIFLLGYGVGATSPNGNIIRGNKIGSENDNLITWGIQSEVTLNTIIENNILQNIRYYGSYGAIGINAYGGYGNIIRNNVVNNIYADGGDIGAVGILLSGFAGPGTQGSNNLVYNNMVYDISSSSTIPGATVAGIEIWAQYFPRIYYNSVYLNGIGNGANPDGSGALYIYEYCEIVVVKNNLLINTRDESPYCASSIYFYGNSAMINSDHNNLYYVQNQNNCLVRSTGGDYFTLAEWQVTGQDVNSLAEMPFYINPYLHMNHIVPTNIESGATPISGIDTDFDGDLRNGTKPDIGADEFNGVILVGLENESISVPDNITLLQNYPNPFNPTTTIGFGIPYKTTVKLTILNSIGKEAAIVLNEEREPGYHKVDFNAVNLPSGVYFYRLKAGDYVITKKMLLIK